MHYMYALSSERDGGSPEQGQRYIEDRFARFLVDKHHRLERY